MCINISGGSRDVKEGMESDVFDSEEGLGRDCTRDHWAGEAATGSAEAKKADLLKSSSSSSPESEVLDCAGEWCLYTGCRGALVGGRDFIVVDNNEGSTWDERGRRRGRTLTSAPSTLFGNMDHGHLDDEENTVDIVVTAPSSPEAQTNRTTSEYGDNDDHLELTFIPLDSLSVPATMSESAQQALPRTPFEDALANASLPEPGPAYFAARREIWTTSRSSQSAQPRQPSKRSQKFQAMLQSEDPLDDVYWNAGLDKIWKGLISGQRVREPLALRELVRWSHLFMCTYRLCYTVLDQDIASRLDARWHLAKRPVCPRTRRRNKG